MASRTDSPREIIFRELNTVYLKEQGASGVNWYGRGNGGTELNRSITIQILDLLARLYVMKPEHREYEYYHRTIKREITNLIWMVWPGGSTAEYFAERIIRELGIEDQCHDDT